MKTGSCKAKGRRAAVQVKELLMKYAPDLKPGDIEVTSSSVIGEDLKLSPAAREKYNVVVEVKNQERLNIWDALKQCEGHECPSGATPVTFFRRNRSELYVALKAEDFVRLIS